MPFFRTSDAARAARRSCGALVAGVLLSSTLGAQAAPRAAAQPASPWSLDGEYLHVGAGPIDRHAGRSMGATLRRDFGGEVAFGFSVDGGWMRAARVSSTAQGVTLGASLRVPVRVGGTTLTLRPGVAGMGGWAEAQQGDWLYDWRGVANTQYAGQTGSETNPVVGRGRATGVGALLGAELRVSSAFALTGSLRQWRFMGDVIRPHRDATLAGLGLVVRPGLGGDAMRALRAMRGVGRPAAATASSTTTPSDSTHSTTATSGR